MWMLSSIGAKVWGYLAGALAILGAVAAIWNKGRKDGIQKIEAEQKDARLDAIEKRKTFDEKVSGMDDDTLDRQLGEWVRRNK